MYKKLISCFFSIALFSQNSFSSNQNEFNREFNGSGLNLMLNGAGFSMLNANFLNSENPATWPFLKKTTIDFSYNQTFSEINKQNKMGVNFNSFSWVSQIKDSTLSIGLRLKPLLSLSNNIYEIGTFNLDTNQIVIKKSSEFKANINEMTFATAYKFDDYITASFQLNYYFGTNNLKKSMIGETIIRTVLNRKTTYTGYGFGFNVLKIQGSATVSAGVTFASTINSYSFDQEIVEYSIGNQKRSEGTFDLPFRLNLGFAHLYKNNNKIYADYKFENWKSLPIHGIFLGYESSYNQSVYSGFWDRSIFFMGTSLYNENFKYSGTDPINNLGINVGMSIPFNADRNRFNIAVGYQYRSTNGVKSLSENIIKINLGLSIGEWWYLPEIED